MPDYSQGKIYYIQSTQDNLIYIGSTTQKFKDRMNQHKRDNACSQLILRYPDCDYGIIESGRFIPYEQYTIDGREIEESDMILGVSRDVYNNGDDARVIYLDPKVFGGSFTKPPLYVKPQKHDGWYGYINVLFPEYTPCKPHNQDLIDFDEIKGFINKHYPSLPEDPRLTGTEECTREVPFNRILTRQSKIGLYTIIMAAIRIYASTHLFKAIPVFSKIMPKFPENFSTIYSAYMHAFASGNLQDISKHRKEVFSLTRQIGQLVKYKLQTGAK